MTVKDKKIWGLKAQLLRKVKEHKASFGEFALVPDNFVDIKNHTLSEEGLRVLGAIEAYLGGRSGWPQY